MKRIPAFITAPFLAVLLAVAPGCDHGLEPPAPAVPGTIHGIVRYTGAWPPPSEVVDLRFVAMRFVPQDTADFLQLTQMAISGGLRYGVESDTFTVPDVLPGVFVYAGVAQQFTENLLSWRPLGLITTNGGIFDVRPGQTTSVEIDVDFADPPPFPPPAN